MGDAHVPSLGDWWLLLETSRECPQQTLRVCHREQTQEAEPHKAKCPAKRAIQGLSHPIQGVSTGGKEESGDSRGPGKPMKERR